MAQATETDWPHYAQQSAAQGLVALTIERDSDCAYDVDALDIGPACREAVIDKSEVADFYKDLIGLTPEKVERFNNGFGVVVQISVTDWASWLAGFEVVDD